LRPVFNVGCSGAELREGLHKTARGVESLATVATALQAGGHRRRFARNRRGSLRTLCRYYQDSRGRGKLVWQCLSPLLRVAWRGETYRAPLQLEGDKVQVSHGKVRDGQMGHSIAWISVCSMRGEQVVVYVVQLAFIFCGLGIPTLRFRPCKVTMCSACIF